ncbi:putative transmembrane protein [Apostichopus japonicus]|uniref:Transmembrane protein 19 n=1 Tax=Stichopus japonicus TaxID=307972 RepID=A0A2G8KMU1_STIJA|nr:putative transmembrane protein [Apostichopus japonicus]
MGLLNEVMLHTIPPWKWLFALLVPLFMAIDAFKKKKLNRGGAFAAYVAGFITMICSYSFFLGMTAFFYAGSKVTKYKASLKQNIEDDYKEGGQRTWIQVFTNGFVGVLFSLHHALDSGFQETPLDFEQYFHSTWLAMAVLSSFACCSGDTWASEIGSVSGPTRPTLITTWVEVPVGTNGAISMVGTLSSIAGGAVVGLGYYVGILLSFSYNHRPPCQWFVIVAGAIAGLVGSFVDSLLGATFQYSGYCRKRKCVVSVPGADVDHISGSAILSNEAVNLVASFITAITVPPILALVWPS